LSPNMLPTILFTNLAIPRLGFCDTPHPSSVLLEGELYFVAEPCLNLGCGGLTSQAVFSDLR
jgi:hypothetical protein